MELRLLGPVEIHAAGQTLNLGVPQRRGILAALAVDAGRLVSRDVLIDRVWGNAAPARVESGIYAHMTGLRKVLEHASTLDPDAPATLRREPGGYRLSLPPESLDLHRSRRLVTTATGQDVPVAERARLLSEALAQWRGTPLTGVPGEWAARMREGWNQERLQATIAWAQAQLILGNAEATLGPLSELAAEHPLAESVTAELLRALAVSGHGADALDRYGKLRQRLVEELGTEPGPELRAVHSELLRGERPVRAGNQLDAPQPLAVRIPASAPVPVPVPRQLPADVSGFLGRVEQLAWLDALLTDTLTPAAVKICAISGTAGVGKTGLAVHWAHQVADKFPDGHLYVDLRGYDPDRRMDPGDAAAMFLRALGVAGRDIPTEGLERFVMLRTLLADRRVLLLLDNAFSVEQVRPLLPGGASCLVLVTSRDSLAGLVARDGARRLELDLLPVTDAVALLRSLIGARVVADPSVATALAQRCGRLPLALRVAAELALARSETSLADLVDELADERQRLDLLDAGGDQRSAVRAVFSWSYRQLPVDVGRAFRLIGVHPGVDFDAPALAALADTSGRDARRIIGALHRAHLVVRAQRDRYAMHDLLRDYARELAMEKDPPPVRRAALTRLYDYCRCAAALAVDVLFPAERRRRPTVPVPAHRVPEFGDRAAATVWLDAELANLEAVSADAAGNGWPAHATDLAAILQRYLQVGAHHREALAIYEHALQAARGSGDTHGEATALTNLGIVHGSCGRLDQAAEWYERALPVLAGSGDLVGEARALFNIGVVKDRQGFDHSAIDYYQRSLKTFRQADDRTGEAAALGGIGNLLRRQGRLADSVALSRQALAITREVGDRLGEARQLNRLGETYAGQGDHVRSAQHHRLALAVAEDIADGARKGEAHYGLGMAHLRQGNAALAVEHQCKALALCDETGESYGRMLVLNGLGEALRALGRTREAVGYHAEALELATAGGNWTEQDRARAGLACGRSAAVDRARMPGSSDRDA